MEKIPSLFVRDWDGDPSRVTEEVDPRCQWVMDGEGVPTAKLDGSACMIREGRLYKRYMIKHGRTAPDGFSPTGDPDSKTGKQTGWVPCGYGPEDYYHYEALESQGHLEDGTYELVGPKVQGNPENQRCHRLCKHGELKLAEFARTYDGIRQYLDGQDIEGIVFHHPDGRMAKIKLSDFGLKRNAADS